MGNQDEVEALNESGATEEVYTFLPCSHHPKTSCLVTMNDDRDDYTLVPFPCIVSQYCVSHTCVSQRHAHLRFVHRGSFRSVPCGPVWKTLMCGDDGTPAYPSPTVHAWYGHDMTWDEFQCRRLYLDLWISLISLRNMENTVGTWEHALPCVALMISGTLLWRSARQCLSLLIIYFFGDLVPSRNGSRCFMEHLKIAEVAGSIRTIFRLIDIYI